MSIEVQVHCRDPQNQRRHKEEVDFALRELKKLMKRDGIFTELRKREFYVAPSLKRRNKRKESMKQRKRDERKAQHASRTSEF